MFKKPHDGGGILSTPYKAAAFYAEMLCYRMVGEPNFLLESLWKVVDTEKQHWSEFDIQVFHELCYLAELETTMEQAVAHLAALDADLGYDSPSDG